MPPESSPRDPGLRHRLPVTLLHALVTVLILFAGAALYVLLTPHKEITLIREGNAAAAVSWAVCWSAWPFRWRYR
jgi:putative membrane protein